MEADNDGVLVRQHHDGMKIKVVKNPTTKYRIQRVKLSYPKEYAIVCQSQYVSKVHCEISRKDGAYWIKDCKSTNGTYLNGHKIETERELRFGDTIGVGISHLDTDPLIDIKASNFFVFLFTKFEEEEVQHEEVNLADSGSEDEISVIEEIRGPRMKFEGSGSADSSPNKKPLLSKSLPMAPPSASKLPIPMQTNTTENSSATNNIRSKHLIAEKKSKETSASTSKDAVPPKGYTDNQPLSTNASRKRNGDLIQDEEKFRKRVRTDSSEVSSDDSSDGLGDLQHEEDACQVPSKNKTPTHYSESECWSPLENCSSDEAAEFNIQKEEISSSASSTGSETELEYSRLKRKALNSTCIVKLGRDFYHLKDNPKAMIFSKELKQQIRPENRQTIRQSYYNLLMKKREKEKPPLPKTKDVTFDKERSRRMSSSSSESDALSDLQSKPPTSKKLRRVVRKSSSSSESEKGKSKSPPPRAPPSNIDRMKTKRKPNPPLMDSDRDDVSSSDEDGRVRDDHDSHDARSSGLTETNKQATSSGFPTSTSVSSSSNAQDVPQRHAGAQQRRSIKFIDSHEYPVPRSVQIAQNRSAPFKKPMPPKVPNRSPVLTPPSNIVIDYHPSMSNNELECRKRARTEKLREVELRKQQGKETEEEEAPAKAKAMPKVKLTSRNRNQGLMEDIVGDKFSDRDSVIGMPAYKPPPPPALSPAPTEVIDINISAPKKLMPPPPPPPVISTFTPKTLPSTSVERSKGIQVIRDPRLESQNYKSIAQTVTSSSRQTVIEKHVPSAPSIPQQHSSSSNAACLLKPGAEPLMSPPPKVAPVVREKIARNTTNLPDSRTQRSEYTFDGRPFLPEDEIYRIMVAWNPSWIEEQKRFNEPPPICNEEVICTVKAYQNYEVYFKTYFPLLIHEIWATICNEAEKRSDEGFNRRISDYKIKIDDLKEEKQCPLTKRCKPKEPWLTIKYHTWVNNINEIDSKKEYLKITLYGKDKDKAGESKKDVFAFGIFNSEFYVPLKSETECDKRLIGSKGSNGFKFCEKVFCRVPSSFTIDRSKLMKIERVCYISPKIREFKSLNMLRSFNLYPNIVNPPEMVKNIWKPSNTTFFKPKMLTICNQRLNQEQLSMVYHIGNRVFSGDPELMLMHGPPGTGKTLTIVCLVLQLISDSKIKLPGHNNRRILICTPSNAAIDEIVRRLVQAGKCLPSTFNGGKKLEILRIGEGFSRDVEEYTLNAKVKAKGKDFSVVTSLKAELERKEEEISEMQSEIARMKADGEREKDMVAYEAKLTKLREAEETKRNLEVDIDNVMKKKNSKEISDMRRAAVLQEADVICATLSASSNSMMKNIAFKVGQSGTKEKPFLCCIIDEASQTTEPESLLPLALDVNKLLLVGDPYQLGATVLSSLAEDKGYGQSLFTRLFEHYGRQKENNPVMMLTQQFRMHPEIVKWPNKFFYNDRLKTPNLSRPKCPLAPYFFMNLTSGREQVDSGQIENVKEVDLVKALINILEECLVSTRTKWSIGVITPYSKQKSVLKREMHNMEFKSFTSVDIDTVDGFQGQEKDIVVVSCVRTDATGFLKSPNRLNVALTRAKHALYIIGDANCLSKDPMWSCLIKDTANRNCKVDIPSDFSSNSKVFQVNLKSQLQLTNNNN